MTTYQALLNKIKSFATAHQQIKRFGSDFTEQFDNFVNEGDSFPVLYVSSVDSLSQLNQITYKLEITCADLILEDRANVNVILNDCKLILNDLFIYYNSGNDNSVHIEVEPTLTPLNNYSVDNLAGARMTVTFEVDTYGLCAIPIGEIPPTPSPDCLDANYTVRYVSGSIIESGVIASGGSKTIQVPDCPAPEPCADGTVNVQQSDATPIASVTVASGGTAPYLVADSVITLNNSVPTLISTTNVKATDNATIVAPDSTAVIKDSAGLTLKTEAIPSNVSENITINDSTVNVQKSDNTLINATTVKAEATTSYNVADSVVNVNSTKLADVKATDTLNITVVDSLDAAVSVTLSGGNKIIVDDLPCSGGVQLSSSEPFKTGQTTSYATNDDGDLQLGNGASFTTLNGLASDYPHNSLNRFTDENYLQVYGAGHIIDWATYNPRNGTVLMWNRNRINGTTSAWADLLALAPFTIGVYSDYQVPNIKQLISIVDYSQINVNGLNYAPFNYVTNTSDLRLWTSTTTANTTANAWALNNLNAFGSLAKSTVLSCLAVRIHTI